MGFARKLELGGGIATCLLGIATASYLVYTDYDTARRLNDNRSLLLEMALALMFFIAPGLLVALGSYFHAVMRKAFRGRCMLIAGSLFLALPLLPMLMMPGYQDITFVWLCLLLLLVAILTLIVSFVVRVWK